jgi:hypothetical protein
VGRHEWKFGGDAMFTRDDNFFPSLLEGKYLYDNIKVDPGTFTPMHSGLELTPLRVWAHNVLRYYVNFGNPVSRPNSNDYASFTRRKRETRTIRLIINNLRVSSRRRSLMHRAKCSWQCGSNSETRVAFSLTSGQVLCHN